MHSRTLLLVFIATMALALCVVALPPPLDNSEHIMALKKALSDERELDNLFSSFVAEHRAGKAYGSETEHAHRRKVFRQSIERALNTMQNQPHAVFGVTKFSDLTVEEFKAFYTSSVNPMKMLAHHPNTEQYKPAEPLKSLSELPDEWDWGKRGAVTGVKDQGQCGSCWAFSTTGNIEGQWFLKNGTLVPLSEAQFVDCDHTCDPDEPSDCNNGCNGGLMNLAFEYAIKNGFVATEHSYPYRPYKNTCKPEKMEFGAKISSWTMFPKNQTELANSLISNGPISIGVDASNLMDYRSGILHGFGCSTKEDHINHGVLLVAYGSIKEWFSDKRDYFWRIKNSWGGWGEGGYYRLWMTGAPEATGYCCMSCMALSSRV